MKTRSEAYEAFRRMGLPDRNDEAWKYTSLRGLNEASFSFPDRAVFAPESDAALKKILSEVKKLLGSELSPAHTHLIFINGFFLEPASLPPGLSAGKGEPAFPSLPLGSLDLLNRSFSEPVFFRLGKDVVLDKPVHFIFISGNVAGLSAGPLMAFPRLSFHLENGSRVRVLESHVRLNEGGASTFSDSHSAYTLSEGSWLQFHQVQGSVNADSVSGGAGRSLRSLLAHASGMAVSHPSFDLGANSKLDAFLATVGAAMERANIRVRLGAEGAEAKLSGIYLLEESRHTDFHLDIHHALPNTTSQKTFKGILDGQSRAV
ncbi:MAG: SufD family Fe-S cluster assembly protein, partial [Spirochaetia bacterium]|nr:SufD family Fe-S cluster assembly protein [Spirochaetia bacterium]